MSKITVASPQKKELQKSNNVERKQSSGNFIIVKIRV